MARPRTAKQKAALRKAQLASARKRRGKGKGKLAAANRALGPRKSRTNKVLKYGAIAAATGAVAFHVAGTRGINIAGHTYQHRLAYSKDAQGGLFKGSAASKNGLSMAAGGVKIGSRRYGIVVRHTSPTYKRIYGR